MHTVNGCDTMPSIAAQCTSPKGKQQPPASMSAEVFEKVLLQYQHPMTQMATGRKELYGLAHEVE